MRSSIYSCPYADHVHTITADNGSEFVEHKAIVEALGRSSTLRIRTRPDSVG